MQDRVCLRRRRTINAAGKALALHCLTVSLMPRKSVSPPVLFSGIEAIHSSTHGPITTSTPSRVPSYVSIINIASSCHYSATIDFPPARRYFEYNPTLPRDWYSEMCRASTVRGQWECWSQESNIGYTSIYLGASSLCPFSSPAAVMQDSGPPARIGLLPLNYALASLLSFIQETLNFARTLQWSRQE